MIPVLWKGKEIMIPKIVNKSNDHWSSWIRRNSEEI